MATYVYSKQGSLGARALADALGAVRVRKFDGISFWKKGKRVRIQPGDVVISWGSRFPNVEGVRVLNGADYITKYSAAIKLLHRDVRTIEVRTTNASGWLPRKNDHVGGDDLLTKRGFIPDFYSRKENITEEYRLHSFNGKSIRAGKKIPRAVSYTHLTLPT